MRFLLVPLLLLAAGCRGADSRDQRVDATSTPQCSTAECNPADCDTSDCRVTVEPTGRGTCLVTCYELDGSIRCQEEIDCDEPCAKSCDGLSGACPKGAARE